MSRIETILVANRGEIAARVIRGCRKLGRRAVVLYHDVDRDTLPVRLADAAFRVDGPSPMAAYLSIDDVVAACRSLGADAVHPGFGFLAENAALPRRLAAEGLRFIGPSAAAIAAMGDKIEAKRIARDAGVATIPGFDGVLQDAAHALHVARSIGFPVILKASAGGGGRGIRIVRDADPAAVRDAFERTTAEAQAAFGDPRIFVERYVEDPRHIEIQVLADAHGHVIHLGERECSIQRRHQKIVEEAPSPFVGDALRSAMGSQAVALARAVGYESAGTVEFLVDRASNFYFMEMNTRIQVEHPVTEMITGVDIVEQQIRIADGEALGLAQSDIRWHGHAIECRLCAEDAERDFMPATGRLEAFRIPDAEGLRVDAGVGAGDTVGAHFDSLLAKLVAHGATREEAIARLASALDATVALGVATNGDFLARMLRLPAFVAGETTTGFLDRHRETLRQPGPAPGEACVALAAALLTDNTWAGSRFAPPPLLAEIGAWRP